MPPLPKKCLVLIDVCSSRKITLPKCVQHIFPTIIGPISGVQLFWKEKGDLRDSSWDPHVQYFQKKMKTEPIMLSSSLSNVKVEGFRVDDFLPAQLVMEEHLRKYVTTTAQHKTQNGNQTSEGTPPPFPIQSVVVVSPEMHIQDYITFLHGLATAPVVHSPPVEKCTVRLYNSKNLMDVFSICY